MVYLAGKDEQGKTIYIEEDGMTHRHKTKEQAQQSQQHHKGTIVLSELIQLKVISARPGICDNFTRKDNECDRYNRCLMIPAFTYLHAAIKIRED